jgi:hypothetical protein
MTLDQIERRLERLDSAIEYLREFDLDHKNPGEFFVLEHLADDLDALLDPLHRLITDARLKRKPRGRRTVKKAA